MTIDPEFGPEFCDICGGSVGGRAPSDGGECECSPEVIEIDRRSETECPFTLAEIPAGDSALQALTWVHEFVWWDKGWEVVPTPDGCRYLADAKETA